MKDFEGGIILDDTDFEPVTPELNVESTSSGMVIEDLDSVEILADPQLTPSDNVQTDKDAFGITKELLTNLNIPTELNIVDEDGQPKLYKFEDLTPEAQLDFIKQELTQNLSGFELSLSERELIETIRNSTGDVESFVDVMKRLAIEDANSTYSALELVREMSDEQIYLNDLLTKYPNISDEDAYAILVEEQKNKVLFDRKAELLRELLLEQTAEDIRKQHRAGNASDMTAEEFKNTLLEISSDGISTEAVEFDSESLLDTIEFLTKTDAVGRRYIEEVLKDPKELLLMAHLYLNKELIIQDTIKQTAEYLNTQSTKATQNSSKSAPQKHLNLVINNNKNNLQLNKGTQGIPYKAFEENPALKKTS